MDKKKNSNRSLEKGATYTTIVGSRPPGSDISIGMIPRGLEVLIKKASIDPKFKTLLLQMRSRAAKDIDLDLDPSEKEMLDSIPIKQLEKIIDNTKVKPESRRVFLGKAASLMLAAIGASIIGCSPDTELDETLEVDESPNENPPDTPPTRGIRPDRPKNKKTENSTKSNSEHSDP